MTYKKIISYILIVALLIGMIPKLIYAANMNISEDGLNLIKSFEGCKLTAYKALSTEEYYTIGWGHYGADVYEGMTITQQQADEMLVSDLQKYVGYVNTFLNSNGITVNQSQFDALTSFTYNLGNVWVSEPTFQLKTYLINGVTNYTPEQIRTAFTNWNRSGGNVIAGLTRRRNAEADLFLSNMFDSSEHTTHSYSGSYYETDHPHREYQKCSCGAYQYTGATRTVSTCGTCNPVDVSSKYNEVLPFKAYLKGTSTVYPYTSEQLATLSGGEIWITDQCTITAVYSNGACKVTYPAGDKTPTAYVSLSNFVGDTSASLTKQTVNHQIDTYIRASTSSTQFGYIDPGDVIYKLGTSGGMTQIFYPTPDGYKLAWVQTSELTEPTYDTRFNPYCPIKGYPCATADFNTYDYDCTTVIGEIWTSDYCTINAVYANGWCEVTYPSGNTTKTGCTQLSNFVYNVSATHVKYTANSKTTVYKTKDLSTDPGWYISVGDVFYVVGAYGSASQVLYPIDAQYGGGYKLGWIYTSALPKTTYTVSYNANGGSGAPSSQTKTHGTTLTLSTTVPTRTGYAFVGWATSSSANTATYVPGASYTTDANLVLYAVWALNKYEITYDANGGDNAPATQNKAHGTDLTISATVPTKKYTVTFDANGGNVGTQNRQVACTFLGWSANASATYASYQPGETFTINANTTLYAVWQNSTLTQYDIPTREGYVFEGWYTAANGGSQVNELTVISSDMTVYAHWSVLTYGVYYDANGGTNAPATQTKTHGKVLTLSTTVPTRENYSFLGWATEENRDTVQYQPGDTFTQDCDIVLVAVWKSDLNAEKLQIVVESVTASPGGKVQVTVELKNNPGIWGMDFAVTYDKSQLTLTNVINGTVFSTAEWTEGNLSGDKYIFAYKASGSNNITTDGVLATLEFTVSEDVAVGQFITISVSYDTGDIIDAAFENINAEVVSGGVEVTNFIYGDLNGDGFVNKKDSLLMKMYLADKSTSIDMQAADVYVDGVINKKDSLYLKQYLAGWDVELGA